MTDVYIVHVDTTVVAYPPDNGVIVGVFTELEKAQQLAVKRLTIDHGYLAATITTSYSDGQIFMGSGVVGYIITKKEVK